MALPSIERLLPPSTGKRTEGKEWRADTAFGWVSAEEKNEEIQYIVGNSKGKMILRKLGKQGLETEQRN